MYEEKEERDRLAHKSAANAGKVKRGRAKAKGNNNRAAAGRGKTNGTSNEPAAKKNGASGKTEKKEKAPVAVNMKRVAAKPSVKKQEDLPLRERLAQPDVAKPKQMRTDMYGEQRALGRGIAASDLQMMQERFG